MNVEHFRHLACLSAFVDEALTGRDLFQDQLGKSFEPYATLHGRNTAGAGAVLNQRAFDFGDAGVAGEHGQHYGFGRRCRVRPRLAQREHPGTGIAQLLCNLQQIAGRVGQAAGTRDLFVVNTPSSGLRFDRSTYRKSVAAPIRRLALFRRRSCSRLRESMRRVQTTRRRQAPPPPAAGRDGRLEFRQGSASALAERRLRRYLAVPLDAQPAVLPLQFQ